VKRSWFLATPCADCPFLREGGIRLTSARVKEIAGGMLATQGHTFTCHKAVDRGTKEHCGGALIFAEKHNNQTQMMRIAERLRLYDHTKLRGHARVFDTLKEMLATALDARSPRRRNA
jgi:hypothetical protein